MHESSRTTDDPGVSSSTEVTEPTVIVRGQHYAADDARRLALQLRCAADRVQFADAGAIEVLQACAAVAGINLVDLAREVHVGDDPKVWTRYEARCIAVALGELAATRQVA